MDADPARLAEVGAQLSAADPPIGFVLLDEYVSDGDLDAYDDAIDARPEGRRLHLILLARHEIGISSNIWDWDSLEDALALVGPESDDLPSWLQSLGNALRSQPSEAEREAEQDSRDDGEDGKLAVQLTTLAAIAVCLTIMNRRAKAGAQGLQVIGLRSSSVRRGMRVRDLAHELGLSDRDCLNICRSIGIGVTRRSSRLDSTQADRIRQRTQQGDGLRESPTPSGSSELRSSEPDRPQPRSPARSSPVRTTASAATSRTATKRPGRDTAPRLSGSQRPSALAPRTGTSPATRRDPTKTSASSPQQGQARTKHSAEPPPEVWREAVKDSLRIQLIDDWSSLMSHVHPKTGRNATAALAAVTGEDVSDLELARKVRNRLAHRTSGSEPKDHEIHEALAAIRRSLAIVESINR